MRLRVTSALLLFLAAPAGAGEADTTGIAAAPPRARPRIAAPT